MWKTKHRDGCWTIFAEPRLYRHTQRSVWFGSVSIAAHAAVGFWLQGVIVSFPLWPMQTQSKRTSDLRDLDTPHVNIENGPLATTEHVVLCLSGKVKCWQHQTNYGVVHPSHHPLNVVTCWTKFLCAMSSTGYAVPLLLWLLAGEAAVMTFQLLLFSVGEIKFTKVLFFFA